MATFRFAIRPWTLAGIVVWTLVMLVNQVFFGNSVGGPGCRTDPACGERGWIPTATFVGGILLILAFGYVSRPASEPATTTKDKVVGVGVVLGILLVAGAAFALVLERPFV